MCGRLVADAEDREIFDTERIGGDFNRNKAEGDHLLAHGREIPPAVAGIVADEVHVEAVHRSAQQNQGGGDKEALRAVTHAPAPEGKHTAQKEHELNDEHIAVKRT